MNITWRQDGIENLKGRVVTVFDGVERYWAEFPNGNEANAVASYVAGIGNTDFDPSMVQAEIFNSVEDGLAELSTR